MSTIGTLSAAETAALESLIASAGYPAILNAIAITLNVKAAATRANTAFTKTRRRANEIDNLALQIGRCSARSERYRL